MESKFNDPRGEYRRQCPYCLEYITVDHMNRIYCPERNGIENFCKNRFKRLKKDFIAEHLTLNKFEVKKLKRRTKQTIDDAIYHSIVLKNKTILKHVLFGKESITMALIELKRAGFEPEYFHSEHTNARGIQLHRIGEYVVGYLEDNKVYITHFKNLSL
jgi:hypothetical protein